MKPGIDHIGVSVTFACHDGMGNFLFGKRSNKARDEQGAWSFGGGVVDFREKIEKAALRELQEEYCCSGIIEETLPAYPNKGQETHWIYFPFIIRVNKAEIIIQDREKITEMQWLPLSKLPTPLHSGLLELITTNKAAFSKYSPFA